VSSENKPKTESTKDAGSVLGRFFGHSEAKNSGSASYATGTKGSALNLGDIQGFIVRGYRMPMVRHFLLSVSVPAAARKILGRVVSGNENETPQITTAEEWHVGFEPGPGDNPAQPPRHKPDYCLNVGITWPGMVALEINKFVPNVSFSPSAHSQKALRRERN